MRRPGSFVARVLARRQLARPAYKKPLRVASGLGKLFDEHFRQLHPRGGPGEKNPNVSCLRHLVCLL